jgi:hypothetical protein
MFQVGTALSAVVCRTLPCAGEAGARGFRPLGENHLTLGESMWCMKTKLLPQKRVAPRSALQLTLLCGALGLFAGCASEPVSHVVSAPPPAAPTQTQTVVVPATTPATTPGGAVVVTQAPPPVQQEPVLAQPSSRHVWIPGYWTWRDSRYVWVAGRWEVPPRTDAVWIAPRWVSEGGAYRFYEGYWQ